MLETGNLTIGSISLAQYGAVVNSAGIYEKPKRDYEMVHIPGRNGDLHIDNGVFENVEVTYTVLFPVNGESYIMRLNRLFNAIMSQIGYLRLEDDFDSDHYRMGILSDFSNAKTGNDANGKCSLTFNCKPQRFLKSGDVPVEARLGEFYWTGNLHSNVRVDVLPAYQFGGHWVHPFTTSILIYLSTGGAGTIKIRAYRNDGYYAEETAEFEAAENDRPIMFSETHQYDDDTATFSEDKARAFRSAFSGVFRIQIDPDIVSVGYTTDGGADTFPARVLAAAFTNPTLYASKPIYEVVGYGDIRVGEVVITINSNESIALTLDAETKNATYTATGEPANNMVVGEIPDMPPGDVGILAEDTIESITITPRWYEL